MHQRKERKFLATIVAAQSKQPASQRRRSIVAAVTWLASAFSFFVMFQYFGMPDSSELAWLVGAFIVGVVVGVVAIRDASRDQWPVLRDHIDFESVKSRLAELES